MILLPLESVIGFLRASDSEIVVYLNQIHYFITDKKFKPESTSIYYTRNPLSSRTTLG